MGMDIERIDQKIALGAIAVAYGQVRATLEKELDRFSKSSLIDIDGMWKVYTEALGMLDLLKDKEEQLWRNVACLSEK